MERVISRMSAGGSQPAKKKRKTIVVDLEEESDDTPYTIHLKRNVSSSQRSYEELNPKDNPDAFYSQTQHPKFHTRVLERAVQKQRAWSKTRYLKVHDLFFVASAPKKLEDLAINPKQLNKLKTLLSQEEGYGRTLLVTGPAGCGKSTSVDVVAKSLKVEVLKWERSGNLEVVSYGGDSYLKEESELNSLLTFLRSSTIPTKNKGRKSEKPRRRLYHIDDLPTLAYQDVAEFRRLIYPFLQNTRHIVVFDLTTRDSSWHMSPKRVFSTQFINSLNICELSFYPIANTFMRKGLRRAVDVLGFHSRLSIQDYRAIEKIANGDIRSAINVIQFSLLSSREKFSVPDFFEASSNDELFHMLGSLLYAKRQSETDYPDVELNVREDLRRPSPTREINDVLSMSRASAETVMMFLHEHEPNFSGSIASTRKVLDAMSVSDAMSEMWESRHISQEYSSQVLALQYMCTCHSAFYNFQGRIVLFKGIARGFYAYNRPKWCPLADRTTQLKREINEEFRFSFGSSEQHCADICVPYLSMIKPPTLTSDQYRLMSYLTRPWNFSWSTERELWNHRMAADPAYQTALSRDNSFKNSLSSPFLEEDDSDEEVFVIEDSEEEVQSDDSFDEPVTFH
ncbi:Rad17 cell cycle checkpoint protein [Ostertagia ostertagi]